MPRPVIVFASTRPRPRDRTPRGMVKVYPRPIDLENRERLGPFTCVTAVNRSPSFKKPSRSGEAKSRHEGTHSILTGRLAEKRLEKVLQGMAATV